MNRALLHRAAWSESAARIVTIKGLAAWRAPFDRDQSGGTTVGASLGRGVGASLVGCNDGVALGDVSDARVKGASTRSPWIDLKTYAR